VREAWHAEPVLGACQNRRHAARYEAEFLADMDALGCRPPHVLSLFWLFLNRRHAARYEAEFLADMDALGCRPPHVLTRVSEYMGEIRAYVDRIAANGMAYARDGSVYFDTQAFRCAHSSSA
jgi:cysteinyl-tRNA synthetase